METQQKATILIVEDDLDIADMLNSYFRVQGYNVITVNWGEDGIRACQTTRPDLVILDIRLPDIDGFEVAKTLRINRRTKDIPIIFLTEKRERNDRLRGLELKADDYITKPFDVLELRLRVRNVLNRSKQGTLTNPVTGIAEGGLVDEQLRVCSETSGWAIAVVSIKNLDVFREVYGFVASDDLLRAVAMILHDSMQEFEGDEDFLGHIGTNDFLMITKPERLESLKERVKKRLEQSFDYFYRDQDRTSNLFKDRYLAVDLNELLPPANANLSLQKIKQELDKFI
ncbi:MAG: response regulator [Anaerolineaceae bacterium]|nr:response regulator [Anaerolineaceae bacterium]